MGNVLGSDDWLSTPNVFTQVFQYLDSSISQGQTPDLLVCRGRYAHSVTLRLTRPTIFRSAGVLNTDAYRRALWFGSTPPHQATLFGPGARRRLNCYAPDFRLSADLDYFLQLSSRPGLLVHCLDLEFVYMPTQESGQQTQRRLQEVVRPIAALSLGVGGSLLRPVIQAAYKSV